MWFEFVGYVDEVMYYCDFVWVVVEVVVCFWIGVGV